MKLEDVLFHLYGLSVLPALPQTKTETRIDTRATHFLPTPCGQKWIEISSWGGKYVVKLVSSGRSANETELPIISIQKRVKFDCVFFFREKLVVSFSADLLRRVVVYSVAGNQFSQLSSTELDLKTPCLWPINHMHHFESKGCVHLIHIESLSRIAFYTLTANDHIKKKKCLKTAVWWSSKRWFCHNASLWTSALSQSKRLVLSQKQDFMNLSTVYHPQVVIELKLNTFF